MSKRKIFDDVGSLVKLGSLGFKPGADGNLGEYKAKISERLLLLLSRWVWWQSG